MRTCPWSQMYTFLLFGSNTVFHVCVTRPLYHQLRGSDSFMDEPLQKHNRRRRVHVVQTGFEGQDWVGNMSFDGCGWSWPFNAHAHIVNPLLVQMSANVVALRYNLHHCAWMSSFFVMPGRFDKCSMMNASLCH